ncbi:YccF domain-containing protein [Pseudolabrys taiwanensis]|uniref:Inner membrane protein YccF n=1 Tax=Pseudolabrys taiwanensis TaxID=331696 RepID=A0A345ZS18_9HYPH|nr:YccF domain-containing protein [Pseudolabrys taiwanensis]AXK79715.1 YccF domain-containing protein [Pseudolabrys taiwanensis]
MSPVSLLLNVLWIVCGGIWLAAGWVVAAIIMAITIIGLPWAKAALNIAVYTLLPFGYTVVDKPPGTFGGLFALIGNIIWLVLAGWWLALGHLIAAILLAITIIGVPFAWAHLKLAGISLWPLGREIVPIEDARRLVAR